MNLLLFVEKFIVIKRFAPTHCDNVVDAALVGGGSDFYDTTFSVPPGSEYSLLFGTSNLDLSTITLQTGVGYQVDVQILYDSGGLNHTETGRVTGTIQQA